MTILIGTDEAGYGPNLGPLVIGASAWEVPDDVADVDLYDRLAGCVCRAASASERRLAIADSKQLYKPGGSLAALEVGVHASLALLDRAVSRWRDMFTQFDGCSTTAESLAASPWYCDFDEEVPVDLNREHLAEKVSEFSKGLCNCTTTIAALQATLVFPTHFNQRVYQLGSKGSLLTERTLQLARDVIARCPVGDVVVFCDKHGGRNRYAAALQHTFPESWVEILAEGRAASEYRLTIDGREVRFRFAVGGESQMPSALASMTAKYLRELAMRAFNAFWQREVPGLRPTAGYPTDAKRFKADIAAAQRQLKIHDDDLWRCK